MSSGYRGCGDACVVSVSEIVVLSYAALHAVLGVCVCLVVSACCAG